MNLRVNGLLFLLCFVLEFSHGQHNQNIDSLLQVYQSQEDTEEKINTVSYLFNAVLYSDPEQAKKYALEELSLSSKFNKIRGIGMAHYHLGTYYNTLGLMDSAQNHFQEALASFSLLNLHPDMALAYSALAMGEYDKANYDKALILIDSVIFIFQSLNDSYRTAVMQGFKGGVYRDKGNYILALDVSLKALRILDTLNKPIRKADLLIQTGNIEFLLGNYESSLQYTHQAYDIFKQFEDEVTLADAANDIGKTYLQLKDYKLATQYLEQALELSREFDVINAEGTALVNLGKVYIAQKAYSKAIRTLNDGLELHEKGEFRLETAEAMNELGVAYTKYDQPNYALQYFDNAISIFDTIGAYDGLSNAFRNRSRAYEKSGDFQMAL